MIEVVPFITLIIIVTIIKAHELRASKEIESIFVIDSPEFNKATIAMKSLAGHQKLVRKDEKEKEKEVIKLLQEYIKQLK